MVAEIGGSLVWSGGTYPAIITDPAISFDPAQGGLVANGDFVAKIRRAAFTGALPQAWDTMTIDGTIYKVRSITDKPGSPWLIYTLER